METVMLSMFKNDKKIFSKGLPYENFVIFISLIIYLNVLEKKIV